VATTTVAQILSGVDLVPHVEQGAYQFAMRRFAMAPRVLTLNDMQGWNTRKVSEYKKVRGAQSLDEATDIPSSQVNRKRLAEVVPLEWGDRYPITDRRQETDPEAILRDTISFLGYSLGVNKEQQLMAEATQTSSSILLYDQSSNNFSINYPIDLQQEFHKKVGGQEGAAALYCVIHPFQAREVLKALIDFTGSQANLAFRERAISGWTVPGFDNMNISVSEWVPRKVSYKVDFGTATGGTFKLEIGTRKEAGVDITASITFSATPATLVSNIDAALNGLTGQAGWVVSGTDITNITVTAPIFLDAESEFRLATDVNGDAENHLTGAGAKLVVSERTGAIARSPVFQREAIVHDVRHGIRAYQELVNQGRTLEVSAYEVFGVELWRPDRIMQIDTLAESVFAV